MMTLDEHIPDSKIPKKTDTYTSWESLNDRTSTGRHLPPDPKFNSEGNLPKVEDLAVLFRKRDGKTIYSTKSTMLFPYWVQWFTDRLGRQLQLASYNDYRQLCGFPRLDQLLSGKPRP